MPGEVRAAWRALFLPDSEGAGVGAWLVRPLAPSSMQTSAPPFSLLMSSRSVRLSPCTTIAEERKKAEKMDVMLLIWGTNG